MENNFTEMAKRKTTEEQQRRESKIEAEETRESTEGREQSSGHADGNGTGNSGQTAGSDTASAREIELVEKLAEMQDKYLRLSAEFDNYRKRTLKEKMELTRTASESVILKILPVFDDFERGVKVMESATDCSAMHAGLALIYNKFRSFLDQNGVKEIDALNRDFDLEMHDAVTKVPAPEKKMKGKVVDVVEKGYILNDKVIRFSKVIVGE
jgi:molecular chaperone GrpE